MKNLKLSIKYQIKILKEYPIYVLSKLFMSITRSIISILSVAIIQKLINALGQNRVTSTLVMLVAFIVIQVVFNIIETYLSNLILPKVKEKISLYIQTQIFEQSSKYSIDKFDDKNFLNDFYFVVMNSESSLLSQMQIFIDIIGISISIAGIASILVGYDIFIIVLLIVCIVLTTIIGLQQKRIRTQFQVAQMNEVRKESYIKRRFLLREHIADIYLFNLTGFFITYLKDVINRKIDLISYYGKRGFKLGNIQSVLSVAYSSGILLYLSIKTLYFSFPIGSFFVTYYGAQKLVSQLLGLMNNLPLYYESSLFLDKFFKFMQYEKNAPYIKENIALMPSVSSITLENVLFSYSERIVLRNVNIALSGNGIYGIYGENGAGKTTLLKIMSGLYQPSQGKVLYNKNDCNNYANELHNHITLVLPGTTLIATTIAKNIVLKHKIDDVDRCNIIKALEQVDMWDKIRGLPKGIDSEISKEFELDGLELSQGEKHRLILARAYVRQSDVIILDEPFSSIDDKSKSIIMEAMKTMAKNKIIIFVSHDYTSLNESDELIYVKKDGCVEQYKNNREKGEKYL
ncbi:MAG: ABC transporter ATP-binding protein [Clostridia bacterium]|nr:ABC transporter ATP-binding protein [Clostridia bacterium]MDD4542378.1 ABC transporter ATP-binding protein [Clostridia bacterium]